MTGDEFVLSLADALARSRPNPRPCAEAGCTAIVARSKYCYEHYRAEMKRRRLRRAAAAAPA